MENRKFTKAIVKPPAASFIYGLSTAGLGAPDHPLALRQHAAYRDALTRRGVEVIVMEADPDHPDSTFVEDTAVLTHTTAVLTIPGADSRKGEVAFITPLLSQYFERIEHIESPGTLDGGDICEADDHFLIGISARTNPEGARQLAAILKSEGYDSTLVPLSPRDRALHLKTSIAYIGEGRLVVTQDYAQRPEFSRFHPIVVAPEEAFAANCIRVNDCIFLPSHCPTLTTQLNALGYQTENLDVSEYQKLDGGLSCLSLRF